MANQVSATTLFKDAPRIVAEQRAGVELQALIERIYPICRSITGDGVRETLSILSEYCAIRRVEVPSGMKVLDWTIPDEWNIRDAYIADRTGKRLVDFRANSLHVVSYSVPVNQLMEMRQLRPHLHTLPEQPEVIPYRTSYYNRNWGFCLSQRQLDALGDGPFEVVIDSTLEPGSLTIGEIFIPGEISEEILISTHVCHPSMANDNCSGLAIAVFLAAWAEKAGLRHSLRVVFVPGTIGSLAWLALNDADTWRIAHGLVITGLGDRGELTYKRSRLGNAKIDRVTAHVLGMRAAGSKIIDFSPWGYDERQYCSPGFNLPVGRLTRSPHGEFQEYHTSADNLSFVSPEALEEALLAIEEVLEVIDQDRSYLSTNLKGEPQLGKYGLYRTIAGQGGAVPEMAMLWVLSQSDGHNTLFDIAHRSGAPFADIKMAADALHKAGLLDELSNHTA